MKYIRTKDGIYSYEPTHNIDVDGFVIQHNLTGWNKPLTKEDIIKITNTIEELCDEFVAIYKDENKSARVLETFGDYRQLDEKQLIYNIKNGWHIYGAIWTDKGLIYVAKMNEKGELKLL